MLPPQNTILPFVGRHVQVDFFDLDLSILSFGAKFIIFHVHNPKDSSHHDLFAGVRSFPDDVAGFANGLIVPGVERIKAPALAVQSCCCWR